VLNIIYKTPKILYITTRDGKLYQNHENTNFESENKTKVKNEYLSDKNIFIDNEPQCHVWRFETYTDKFDWV